MVPLLVVSLTLAQSGPATSVYRISFAVDVPVTAGAFLASGLAYAYSAQLIHPRCPCNRDKVNGFDRPAIGNSSALAGTMSDITVIAALLVPLVFDAVDLGLHRPFFEDAVVFAETIAVNVGLAATVKFIVQRPLPLTYAGDPDLLNSPGGYRSFYSEHTSLTFAALSAASMTIRLRYGEQVWPWIVTGLVGSSVAIERVAAGRHFPTDVIVGAVVGTATGIGVPWLHARGESTSSALILLPGPNSVAVGWVKQF